MAVAGVGLELYRRELLKGSTETLILSLLAEQSMHGYHLVKEIERRSSGYFHLKEGTLYPAIHRIERDGLVESRWEEPLNGQNKKIYEITLRGKERLMSMLQEWDLFTKAVNLIAGPVSSLVNGVARSR